MKASHFIHGSCGTRHVLLKVCFGDLHVCVCMRRLCDRDAVALKMVSRVRAVSRSICHLCRYLYKGPWEMQSSPPTPLPLCLESTVSQHVIADRHQSENQSDAFSISTLYSTIPPFHLINSHGSFPESLP